MRLPFNATCGDVTSWRNDRAVNSRGPSGARPPI